MTNAEIDQKFTQDLAKRQETRAAIKPGSEPEFRRYKFLWGAIRYSVETDSSLVARAKARVKRLDELHQEWDQRVTFQRLCNEVIDLMGFEGEDRRFVREVSYFLSQKVDEAQNQRLNLNQERILRQRRLGILDMEVTWSDKN